MVIPEHNIDIYRGTDFSLTFSIFQPNKQKVNLEGASILAKFLGNTQEAIPIEFEWEISLEDEITISLPNHITETIEVETGRYSVVLIDSLGKHTPLFTGTCQIHSIPSTL